MVLHRRVRHGRAAYSERVCLQTVLTPEATWELLPSTSCYGVHDICQCQCNAFAPVIKALPCAGPQLRVGHCRAAHAAPRRATPRHATGSTLTLALPWSMSMSISRASMARRSEPPMGNRRGRPPAAMKGGIWPANWGVSCRAPRSRTRLTLDDPYAQVLTVTGCADALDAASHSARHAAHGLARLPIVDCTSQPPPSTKGNRTGVSTLSK